MLWLVIILLIADFNPRSPHGERPNNNAMFHERFRISIHAPRMGSDLRRYRVIDALYIFQSTLPAWGATRRLAWSVPMHFISIHAPRMGSDRTESIHPISPGHFNPRSPHGERRPVKILIPIRVLDFNPRSPHGERQHLAHSFSRDSYFNPRSPHGERPIAALSMLRPANFNPRSPHGERHARLLGHAFRRTFQSTLPAWGATVTSTAKMLIKRISIHAPRMGSDLMTRRALVLSLISIHAPRMGSDTRKTPWPLPLLYFNPRSPHGERRYQSE